MTQLRIDLNSDVGESFAAWRLGRDEALIPHVTSVNVACGFHAGDPVVMTRTVELARQHGVATGEVATMRRRRLTAPNCAGHLART